MGKGLAATLVSFWFTFSPNVWAQDVVDWVEPAQERITVVANADEHRQVRFTGGWETADYVVFEWRDLSGEMVYLTANDDSVSIDFPLTAGGNSRLFVSAAAERSYLVRAGAGRSCSDGLRPALYGHRQPPQLLHFCIEQSAAGALRLCLCRRRAIADRDRGLPARCPVRRPRVCRRQFGAVPSTDMAAARQFALGQNDQGESRGLTEVPLGYAVLDPTGGG